MSDCGESIENFSSSRSDFDDICCHSSDLLDTGPQVNIEVLGNQRTLYWGREWQIGTAAYWIASTRYAQVDGQFRNSNRHQLGETLREEAAACILGGFGMPYELGLAAYSAIRDRGLLRAGVEVCAEDIELILRNPLVVNGCERKYRFPNQRADRLAQCLHFLDFNVQPHEPTLVREWLLKVPGIGPKTASWIVRNHFDCDDVAILDIHIMRVGIAAGIFDPSWSAAKNYPLIESFFLEWARIGGVRASDLDSVIWSEEALRTRSKR